MEWLQIADNEILKNEVHKLVENALAIFFNGICIQRVHIQPE